MKFTAEDFKWMMDNPTTAWDPNNEVVKKERAIVDYFVNHPEELVEYEKSLGRDYTPEKIKNILLDKSIGLL